MKCTLFLQYNAYDDNKFDVKDYFTDSNSYIEALNKYATQEGGLMNFKQTKNDEAYTTCQCTLYDENNEEMTIDKFVSYYNTSQLIMLILELDLNTEEEEFDSELNGWVNEHEKLDKIKNLDTEKRFLVEPKRDIKVVFNNKANKETYCTLSNTTILEKVDVSHYIIIVDKVIFTRKF